ncbi:MAG: hypothetical protein GC159_07975 [Phycisphaera sp.]|nr:hypothetical protein [Phycisphaera sp.]
MNTDTRETPRRTQTTGWALLAMAILLGGLLVNRIGLFDRDAHAEMVIDKGSFTVMTARYSNDIEYLYLLDSRTGALIAYMKEPTGALIERVDVLDVNASFDRALKMIKPAGGGSSGPRIER